MPRKSTPLHLLPGQKHDIKPGRGFINRMQSVNSSIKKENQKKTRRETALRRRTAMLPEMVQQNPQDAKEKPVLSKTAPDTNPNWKSVQDWKSTPDSEFAQNRNSTYQMDKTNSLPPLGFYMQNDISTYVLPQYQVSATITEQSPPSFPGSYYPFSVAVSAPEFQNTELEMDHMMRSSHPEFFGYSNELFDMSTSLAPGEPNYEAPFSATYDPESHLVDFFSDQREDQFIDGRPFFMYAD